MRKFLTFLIPFLIFISLKSVFASEQIVIEADRLNVRDGVWGNKLGKVYEGQQFEVTQKKEDWAKIEYEFGKFGWISLDYARRALEVKEVKNISLTKFCAKVDTELKKLGWKDISCNSDDW